MDEILHLGTVCDQVKNNSLTVVSSTTCEAGLKKQHISTKSKGLESRESRLQPTCTELQQPLAVLHTYANLPSAVSKKKADTQIKFLVHHSTELGYSATYTTL